MIIYIYGSESFKKEIHELLIHSNIRLRLDDDSDIVDLNSLEELKNAIEDNPNNIYLIDDTKIIKKNSINKKIKFLKPKDAIEQEYLLDHGIGDISVDSIEELSKHLIRKLESSMGEKETADIQDSIVEIVEDAYSNETDEDDEKMYQLDEELSELLSHDENDEKKDKDDLEIEEIEDIKVEDDEEALTEIDIDKIEEELEEIEKIVPEEKNEDLVEKNSLSSLKDLDFDEDFDNIDIKKANEDTNSLEKEIQGNIQGDDMADEFAEFDTLNENEILEALDELGTDVESNFEVPKVSEESRPTTSSENLEVSSNNINDIANLFSKLLNNKTLEITIKVKD